MSTVSELTEVFTSKLGPDLFEKTGQFIEGIAPFFSLGLSLYVVLLTFYHDFYRVNSCAFRTWSLN